MLKIALLVITTTALVSSDGYGPPAGHDQGTHSDNAHYKFEYSVNDPHTQDVKSQHEQRDGHQVTGGYTLKEADGTTRVVKYRAGPKTGFEAVVERSGQAQHPASYGKQGHGQAYGVPGVSTGGATSHVGVTQWSNQGSDKGYSGYGH